jgi:hypothetical protein
VLIGEVKKGPHMLSIKMTAISDVMLFNVHTQFLSLTNNPLQLVPQQKFNNMNNKLSVKYMTLFSALYRSRFHFHGLGRIPPS